MEFIRKRPKSAILILCLLYIIGVVGLSLELTRELFKAAVPYTLLLSLALLAIFHEKYTLRFIILALFFFIAGIAIEILGVTTGKVFGHYTYGNTLGMKVFDTPIMIGVNWLTLVYMVWIMLSGLKFHTIIISLLGAALMVFYDLFMEPVAIWTDMWTWRDVEVPLQNYIAWFVVSFIFILLLGWLSPGIRNKIAPPLFIIQLVFFIALNIVIKLFF